MDFAEFVLSCVPVLVKLCSCSIYVSDALHIPDIRIEPDLDVIESTVDVEASA